MNCHSNRTFIIPGRLVLQWDFKSYPVANVCAEYLQSIFDQPLRVVGEPGDRGEGECWARA